MNEALRIVVVAPNLAVTDPDDEHALLQAQWRMGLAPFVTEVVAPLTTAVGEAWAQGRFEIFEEHLYTEVITGVLRSAIATLAMPPQPPAPALGLQGPRVLLTTLPREPHGLGLLMLEALLTLEGCVCISLGTQTPLSDIVQAAQAHRTDAIALSFTNLQSGSLVLSQLRELRRQFQSGLYERLALSRDQDGIRQLAQQGQIVSQPKDLLKEPLVLEFLGLTEQARFSESDLEAAIISQIEHFLLELGKGFLFEARQKRFTFDDDHFFVDLVFYNRLLRCYVLIDLKIGKLTHQDLGQMQMYVNYFDRHVKTDAEAATVGIVLCKKKHEALVEITLPKDANIHAREYQLYLPSKEELQQKLAEWAEV